MNRWRGARSIAITMVRDEADMLPRWLRYYGGHLAVENLLVIDDNSTDGSTDSLPCPLVRLPPDSWKCNWADMRATIVNDLASAMLTCYDVVIFSDVDEFLVADPARYEGLLHYLSENHERGVVAPLAVNVLHKPDLEPPLDPTKPLLAQRRYVKFSSVMCKPLLKRIPARWIGGGFHGIAAPYDIDRRLLMLHLKYYDVRALEKVAQQRYLLHREANRGHRASAWALNTSELVSRLLSWVATPAGAAVPEFDPNEPNLADVVWPQEDGFFRSRGRQLSDMERNPLRRLPERFLPAL